VKQPNRRGPSPSAPVASLAARAQAALGEQRFKEAIELFKLALRQEFRAEWKDGLAEAYVGRARVLADKKMFKEAVMVLENTITPEAMVRDPSLYVQCLIRDGQQQKAAVHLLHRLAVEGAVPPAARPALEELTAALLLALPQLPPLPRPPLHEPPRWREFATAARAALAAWTEGAAPEEIDAQLNRVSLRSAFRPVRLLLKSLCDPAQEAERTAQLLATIPPQSPFFPFRQAVEAALGATDAEDWHRLTPARQAFVIEARGLPAWSVQFLARSAEAARSGPAALFSFFLNQPGLPPADARSVCLNLLPLVPDRMPQFERAFGKLTDLERHRWRALAAEAVEEWTEVERSWQAAANSLGEANGLAQGVIYRHLAHLAERKPALEGLEHRGEPVSDYLERAWAVDPDHLPTVLELIGHYRKHAMSADWHRVVDAALQRFPADSQVLQAAIDSAVARTAYKKAAGFARRLLKINAINPALRRQMIELQVAYARKQMGSRRPDLAARALSEATEWERVDDPRPLLRIARGLVALRTGPKELAETLLREGVALADGGVGGWFTAQLEAELMKSPGRDVAWLRQEMVQAAKLPPTKAAVMWIVAASRQPDAIASKRRVAKLLGGLHTWLEQAAGLDWSEAEFETLAELLVRLEAFDLLKSFAAAARRRDPANPAWRFHEVVARTRNDGALVSDAETDDLLEIAIAAGGREDFHAANRIKRFLEEGFGMPRAGPGSPEPDWLDGDDTLDFGDIDGLIETMIDGMPRSSADALREQDRAVTELVAELRHSPIGALVPAPQLRKLAQAMVNDAINRGSQKARATARGGRF
jgi:tetratricopeptide (TPR) repeat protein